jgi:hypothetical protein
MAGKVEIDIAGLEGNEAAQPRVFAHDAVSVIAGDVSAATASSIPLETDLESLVTTNPTDQNPGWVEIKATTSGSGTAVVLRAQFTGAATSATCAYVECLTAQNSGYANGDTLTITATQLNAFLGSASTTNLVVTLNTSTIPLVQKGFPLVPTPTANVTEVVSRGACIYAGVTADIEVKLESGSVVTFKNTAAGSFLPILALEVKSVSLATGTLNDGEILGLF